MVVAPQSSLVVTWDPLPENFVLDDAPVDNINQPAIAAALTESLELVGRIPTTALVMTNYGLCATVNGKTVVKAPDWGYVPAIRVPRAEVIRSYTPHLQGDVPAVVMEFLSETEGGEYSSKPTYPPGKWFFYERVLRVPNYAIFEPDQGLLELYCLSDEGRYTVQSPNADQRFWLAEMGLELGVWQGSRENRTGYWLRWWTAQGELLPWGKEQVEQERLRAERLAAQLWAAGIEPEV